MKHIIVAREEGRFLGWPANDGAWSWADEIVVGYTNGAYEFKEQGHRISGEQPSFPALSRSRHGGESWQREEAAGYNMAAEPIPAEAMDFTHPNLAIRCSPSGTQWGEEIVIRDGAQYGDMGYPRMVARPDGKLETIYYFNSAECPQQHIAATIWDPNEDAPTTP